MNFNEFVKDDFLKLNFKIINVSELVSFLKINPNITKLSVQGCAINDEEVEALANLKNLTSLDLQCNAIGDKGAKALANLKNLTSLNLARNEIGDEGAVALAEALTNGNLKNLTSLDVSSNKIGNKGAKALADLKKVNVIGIGDSKTDTFINRLTDKLTQSNFSIEIFDPAKLENKTTLDEIIIPESLRKELNKILGIIPEKNKALLQKTGYKPEKGYLFYGPPGNGKTKIARAIACQANMKFISISASEFQKSYVGQGEALVRELFKKARANAPCIVFIDEIDCIAAERGNDSSAYANSLVNQFLTELDGFNPLEGVTVIAATNRKDVLDKAFIRPGRLSNHIEIPLPDKTQREEILNLYIKKFKDTEELEVTVDINKLANETDGFSGAELEYLINQTSWDIISNAKIEEKVTIDTSNFTNAIKNLKKKKPQEPESKQVNGGLELLNSPKPNCSSDVHINNADNVESHSSANSNSDVVVTLQQWVKTTTNTSKYIQTQINNLKEEYDEKFEKLDSENSDLKQDLDCVRQSLTKITQCTEEYTQLKDNLKTITEKYTQLQSEFESMVTTELKKHESTLENRVKELNSKYEKFLGASTNSKGKVIMPLFLLYYLEHLLLVQV